MRAIGCRAGQNKITQEDLPISLLSDMVGKIVQVGWLVRRVKNYECWGSVDDESSTKSHARTEMEAGALGLGAGRKGFDDRVLVEEGPKMDGLHSRVDYCYLTV